MVASCFELIGIGKQGLCWSGLEELQWMESVFILSECTVGRALHGVCSVAAGVGVVGETAVDSLTARVAGPDAEAAGATSPMFDVSGLTASRWCSQMWSWTSQYYPPPMTWTRYETLLTLQIMVAGSHMFLVSLRTDIVWPAKKGGFLWQPYWSWYSALWVAHWLRWSHSASACGSVCLISCGTGCVALTGITFLQVNASEHWLVCYCMLVELSMGSDQSTWHG